MQQPLHSAGCQRDLIAAILANILELDAWQPVHTGCVMECQHTSAGKWQLLNDWTPNQPSGLWFKLSFRSKQK